MSAYAKLFAYFGLYFLFMLVFFIILCLICALALLWYHRKQGVTCDLPEETPFNYNRPSTSRGTL